MTYADPAERAALIEGFRSLADYLDSNSDVPVSSYTIVYTFPPDGDCADMRGEIGAIAELLDRQARETVGGEHYTVTRLFGPVEYRAVAICRHHCHCRRQG
ncbi:MAG: hypothetical protein JWM19_3370 [Actinomycetia bacterium]|nr:hypothetical protein [Actinomycetes bacterium]